MPKHEEKYCPRCQAQFECKVGDVINCQCNAVTLTQDEAQFIYTQYHDECLCALCMEEMKKQAGSR